MLRHTVHRFIKHLKRELTQDHSNSYGIMMSLWPCDQSSSCSEQLWWRSVGPGLHKVWWHACYMGPWSSTCHTVWGNRECNFTVCLQENIHLTDLHPYIHPSICTSKIIVYHQSKPMNYKSKHSCVQWYNLYHILCFPSLFLALFEYM